MAEDLPPAGAPIEPPACPADEIAAFLLGEDLTADMKAAHERGGGFTALLDLNDNLGDHPEYQRHLPQLLRQPLRDSFAEYLRTTLHSRFGGPISCWAASVCPEGYVLVVFKPSPPATRSKGRCESEVAS